MPSVVRKGQRGEQDETEQLKLTMRRVAKRLMRSADSNGRQVPQCQPLQVARTPLQQISDQRRSEGRRLIRLQSSAEGSPSRSIRTQHSNIHLLQPARVRTGFQKPGELLIGDGSEVAVLCRVAEGEGAQVGRGVRVGGSDCSRAVDGVDGEEVECLERGEAGHDQLELFEVDRYLEREGSECRKIRQSG